MDTEKNAREKAVHMLRSGSNVQEVAKACGRSKRWVYKWQARYQAEGWAGLESQSRAPQKHGRKLTKAMRRSILRARSELEAETASGQGLKYIGSRAIRTRLKKKRLRWIPSCPTIERVLSQAGMTRPQEPRIEVHYPHLKPDQPHELVQVDIVPHFLTGGMRMNCFNAIDIVSRYPTGEAYTQRRAVDAANFLIHVWQEIGIPTYTQVDNEGCFSGGTTHPYVLGTVARLALFVGTELLFSPVYHPKSNGYVERFHQDYNLHVWKDTYLQDLKQVRQESRRFFALYRQSEHHSRLNERTPAQVHASNPGPKLCLDFAMDQTKLPLYAGRIHFLRRVRADKTVSILNTSWPVQSVLPDLGVWVTLDLTPKDAILSIYDKAPDVSTRICLDTHSFPLTENVLPFPENPKHFLPIDGSCIHQKD
ncbi:MAG TPA: transposase [Alphaproteobacteria bacterium]|nr:transposase [Alphaproteobacteria bacterium]